MKNEPLRSISMRRPSGRRLTSRRLTSRRPSGRRLSSRSISMRNMLTLFFLILNVWVINLKGNHHTIYITGPCETRDWFKKSKLIYKGLKKETRSQGNTIELFPKKRYRESILRSKHRKHYTVSKRQLIRAYEDEDLILQDLVKLIIKRRDEILQLNSTNLDSATQELRTQESRTLDTRIHLRSHCSGSRIIKKLLRTDLRMYLGTLISIDSPGSLYDYDFIDLENIDDLEKISNDIRVDPGVIVNLNINQVSQSDIWAVSSGLKGCSTKKFLTTVGVLVGIIGAILAIL